MTSVLKKSRGTKGKSMSMQEDLPSGNDFQNTPEDAAKLLKYIDDNVIGKDTSFCGPYGRRKVVYCDYSGSGRSLHFMEEYISKDVLPMHATQCTAMSHTSLQSSLYRREARQAVLSAVAGDASDVALISVSPARLLRAMRPARAALFVSARAQPRQLAPWVECEAEIIKIPETKEGFIDLNTLEQKLQENSGTGKRMIGFFSAASKLTGVLADDVATTLLLHQYGAWAFWDYTLVAPSAVVNMNPNFPGVEDEMVRKDAVFFDCEKFVGGVQGPFVAVVKKDIFKNTPLYHEDGERISERLEEAGTVEFARTALVLQLRDAVGINHISERQDNITRQVLSHIKNIPELILLGTESATGRRLPILSLLVKHPRGTFLHHNFVSAVLNDVFGIQARGGLNSDLSYGQDILGIDAQLLREYEKLLDLDLHRDQAVQNEHLRPGFCRISLPFFMSDAELAFVLEALKMVATEGWKILPQYVVNTTTGHWRHHTNAVYRDRKSLFSIRYIDGKMTTNQRKISGAGIFPQTYTECLQTARNLFNKARKLAMKYSVPEQELVFNPRTDYLRWFMLPREAHDLLLGKSANVKQIVPFDPSGFTGARKSLHYNRSSNTSSPILGSSPRHYSLSAIDDCQLLRDKQKSRFYSRESSLLERNQESKSPPVKFALGESVSPMQIKAQTLSSSPLMLRSRCYSLGSGSPPPALSPQTRINLGLQDSVEDTPKVSNFCNCGSQTDLQSLDDPMISPGRAFTYASQSSASISDCSQLGRISPSVSITSHTSEDLQAYVKEMTREITREIKSEIREVISQVDDILDNTDSLDVSNISIHSNSSQGDRNSVSVIDVAEYLMGMSKEMASEVKHEIREMVNQVDEMISPDPNSNSRRSSPPQPTRRRIGSGPDLGLELNRLTQTLKKSPTSPVLPTHVCRDEECFKQSPKTGTPVEVSGPNSISFNSSETSTPETIINIQVVTTGDSPTLPKSMSSNKLSDEECCTDAMCRQFCTKRNWCQNPSVSSQDSGINMSFPETDSYQDFVKWRTSSDPTNNKLRKARLCPRHEREVPDIIEGVPACQPYTRHTVCCDSQRPGGDTATSQKQTQTSLTSPEDRPNMVFPKPSNEYRTEVRQSLDAPNYEGIDPFFKADAEDISDEEDEVDPEVDSSSTTDTSLTELVTDSDSAWHQPPKIIWKPALEALEEFNMVRPGDKVLVCLSGSRESVGLLHTMRHYQMYSRAKGVHFTIGAVFVHDTSKSEVDPLHLMSYCRTLGVKLIYLDKTDEERNDKPNTDMTHWSRWSRHGVRRRVYRAARAHGYCSAALAQTLDHAARAFLGNAFHQGALHAHKAHYKIREQDLRIIRPLIYVRERDLASFARLRDLPDFRSSTDMAALFSDEDNKQFQENKGPGEYPGDDTNDIELRNKIEVRRSLQEVQTEISPRSSSESTSCSVSRSQARHRSHSEPAYSVNDVLAYYEGLHPALFTSLKNALHPLISAKNIEKDLKEHRHRKKSVIQMRNGAPVYDSDEGTDEEPVA